MFCVALSVQANDEQKRKIDSLEVLLASELPDSLRIYYNLKIASKQRYVGRYDDAVQSASKAYEMSEAYYAEAQSESAAKLYIKSARAMAQSLEKTPEFPKAFQYYTEALELAERFEEVKLNCSLYGSISLYFYNQGDYPSALDYGFQQLEFAESLNDRHYMAGACNKVGIVYKREMMHQEALKYLQRSVDLYTEIGDRYNMANSTNNMGDVYLNMGDYDRAYTAYQTQKNIALEIDSDEAKADANQCLGTLFGKMAAEGQQGYADSVLMYLQHSYDYYTTVNFIYEMSDCLNIMGTIYLQIEENEQAIEAFLKAYELAQSNGIQEKTKSAAEGLFEGYKRVGDFQQSLEWHERYTSIKDTIFNTGKERDFGRLEAKHDYEVKESNLLAEQEHEREIAQAEKEGQRKIILAVSFGLVAVVLLLFYLFNRFRFIQAQKKTIEHQKLIVDEKNKEITASIEYAKRIQNAILPPIEKVKELLPENFILYKAKDVVAGDFYGLKSRANVCFLL